MVHILFNDPLNSYVFYTSGTSSDPDPDDRGYDPFNRAYDPYDRDYGYGRDRSYDPYGQNYNSHHYSNTYGSTGWDYWSNDYGFYLGTLWVPQYIITLLFFLIFFACCCCCCCRSKNTRYEKLILWPLNYYISVFVEGGSKLDHWSHWCTKGCVLMCGRVLNENATAILEYLTMFIQKAVIPNRNKNYQHILEINPNLGI